MGISANAMVAPISSATATTLLADRLADGEKLLVAISVVGDRSDYDVWQRRRKRWINKTSAALLQLYEADGASDACRRAIGHALDTLCQTLPQPGVWHEDLAFELAYTRGALDLIRALPANLDGLRF